MSLAVEKQDVVAQVKAPLSEAKRKQLEAAREAKRLKKQHEALESEKQRSLTVQKGTWLFAVNGENECSFF